MKKRNRSRTAARKIEHPAPAVHSAQIRRELSDLIQHLDADRERVDDPRFQALLSTSAAVLRGVSDMYAHYDEERARDTRLRE